GLRRIAERVHTLAVLLAQAVTRLGYRIVHASFFDTLCVEVESWVLPRLLDAARARRINLRVISPTRIGISLDEATALGDLADLVTAFSLNEVLPFMVEDLGAKADPSIPESLHRTSSYLTHPVFHRYRSETEMLRYIKRLEGRDLSLTSAMIPLGSCTMKLNATTEMVPLSWREFNRLHPFAPREQATGYRTLFRQLEDMLAEITGFAQVSLQPNAGSQGEFTGLLVIRAYHRSRGEARRTTCLIPTSAHGTNPASAVMGALHVGPGQRDPQGNIDVADLRAKAAEHEATLAALMVTSPSTTGVFEASIRQVCEIVHAHGGQVYMDGANMNAQVGLCRPADIGADVCHLNLHKTFCIPHGGGGPGMGPICVAAHLGPFLPDHPVVPLRQQPPCGTVSAAPWGGAWSLPISWASVASMGREGLVAGSWHRGVRARRGRGEGRAGSFLRRADLDPPGDPRGGGRDAAPRQQPARECAAHPGRRHRRHVGSAVCARARRLPRGVDAVAQGVAVGEPRGRRVRRSEPGVRVPADGGLCARR